MKRILIIQAQMKQYRVPLFNKLHAALAKDGVVLRVAYSDPAPKEAAKNDTAELPAEYGVRVPGHWLFCQRFLYQPLAKEIARADLVIIEQANKHVMNHLLLVLSALRLKRVAFWGHGRNLSGGTSFSEWFKAKTLSSVDWWFAYTERTKDYLETHGVSLGKITVVENALDSKQFRKELQSISAEEREQARRSLGIAADSQVGLFCGAITPEKRPQFLIVSALRIKKRAPRFELIVVGGGPQEQAILEAAGKYSWIHFLGPQFGRNKALYHCISDVALMPCAVGLGILDAFAAGLPLLTTDDPAHGPEIEYLQEGVNGVAVEEAVERYSERTAEVFNDAFTLEQLKAGAFRSSEQYTVEKMAERFKNGIIQCLGIESRTVALSRAEGIQ